MLSDSNPGKKSHGPGKDSHPLARTRGTSHEGDASQATLLAIPQPDYYAILRKCHAQCDC